VPARSDLVQDARVRDDLATVRLGTAFFRRALDRLTDVQLDEPSLLPGWTRRHVVAHVGYNARAIARLVDWAATGVENPMYPSPQSRAEEIELGATLSPEALRNLSEHAAIELDVRWRDLPADRWEARVVTAQGREVPASETLWMRTREVWLHAVDLAGGARIDDVPRQVLVRLVGDVLAAWCRRGEDPVLLCVTDAPGGEAPPTGLDGDRGGVDAVVVSGSLAALAAWATGRLPDSQRADRLTWSQGRPYAAPSWI